MEKVTQTEQIAVLELLPALFDAEFEEIKRVIAAIQVLRQSYGFFEITSL